MTIIARAYEDENDLYKIQRATADWIAAAGFRGYINPGDIALRLFNGQRNFDPCEIVRLWEDTDGRVLGWSLCYPAWNSYEVAFHPDYTSSPLANEIVDWAERETINQMQKTGRDDLSLRVELFDGDTARINLLEPLGYVRGEFHAIISVRSLDKPIPQPQLPDGFSIRSIQSEQEADKLVAILNDSFDSHWIAEAYQQVLRSPGYPMENEMVVVAPDGRFAASCILLPDVHNHTGMFENVATSSQFRRLGLAKALLYAGMKRMKMQGFTTAMVPFNAELDVPAALYAAVGFQPTHMIYRYYKMP